MRTIYLIVYTYCDTHNGKERKTKVLADACVTYIDARAKIKRVLENCGVDYKETSINVWQHNSLGATYLYEIVSKEIKI